MSNRKPRPWGVDRRVEQWRVSGPAPFESKWFPTFAEAIAYADRQARTVSIYVPRLGNAVALDSVGVAGTRNNTLIFAYGKEPRYVRLPAHELLPLARVLLAHHGKAHADD